jgi:hypothetical protein
MDIVPVAQLHRRARMVVEAMRLHLASAVGVTVQGSHVTVRFSDDRGHLLQVTMVVCEVDDGRDDPTPDPDLDK